jgi:hypothetical protein
MIRRSLPYPRWVFFILRPLNNRHTWRLRLAILRLLDPYWLNKGNYTHSPFGYDMKQKKKPPMPGKGGKKPC